MVHLKKKKKKKRKKENLQTNNQTKNIRVSHSMDEPK